MTRFPDSEYLNIAILCFSGTGNTEYIGRYLKSQFEALGKNCEIIPLEELTLKKRTLDVHAYDLIGLGYPIHAFEAPGLFLILSPASAVLRPGISCSVQ